MKNNSYFAAGQAIGFYDIPLWVEEDPKPLYFELFTWHKDVFGSKHSGSLKEECFDTLDKKILYLKGVFEDYSGSHLKCGENYIHFANSQNKVERCKNWLNDVASFMIAKRKGKLISFKDEPELVELMAGAIEKHEIKYCFPICHRVYIKRAVIDFINNYEPSQA